VSEEQAGGVRLTLDEVRVLARRALLGAGLSRDHAEAVAETMVAGERDGCTSHGIYRLLVAANSIARGVVITDAVPVVSEPARALVKVDGGGGFAQLAFERGWALLAEKARSYGIAAMALNNVVHFAALWPEVEALASEGLVALAFTPSHAWVAPAGGTEPVFEIELHRRAGKSVPDDWGYDANGQSTTDAEAVLAGAMRTFGGHKGSALAAMVELLAGPLIGDMTSRESIAADRGRGGSPIGGELIVTIDPAGFLGDAVTEHLARAEAMFDAIEGQGARLPSRRRYAARARSLVEGVVIAPALYRDIMALPQGE
jgi:delta1-piperideine-2-carboxylate reductase